MLRYIGWFCASLGLWAGYLSPCAGHLFPWATRWAAHYITTQHDTTQHNTTQHNTTQHNTTQQGNLFEAFELSAAKKPTAAEVSWITVSRNLFMCGHQSKFLHAAADKLNAYW